MSRIVREKKTVELMVRLYCRKKERNLILCPSCEALIRYAYERLERCPYGEHKTNCKNCRIHCYPPEMREQMCRVMRFSGPRMLLFAPLAALRHLLTK